MRGFHSSITGWAQRSWPLQCTGFYPASKEKKPLVVARYAGETEESLPFPYNEKYESFARIAGER